MRQQHETGNSHRTAHPAQACELLGPSGWLHLSRLEVCDGGETVLLYDHGDVHHATIQTEAPTEAMQLEAERIIAEGTG